MEDIKSYTVGELSNILKEEGYPYFSAKQIFNWIYKIRIEDFSKMSDLSKDERNFLKRNFYFSHLKIIKRRISNDGTEKFLFELKDKNTIETVFIPEKKRRTICVSTQVGCRFACRFCVSGLYGFVRNLSASEIVNQFLKSEIITAPHKITNVVFMGMGEPLDNFNNLIRSISILTSAYGIRLSKRRISVSTCGIIPKIKEFVSYDSGVKLSVSLHSGDNKKRSQLMPVNKKYPLSEIIKTLRQYAKNLKFPVIFEYILIKDFNSKTEDALKLARLVRGLNCKINIIPYNTSRYFKWEEPSFHDIDNFTRILKDRGVFFTLRKSRGQDIEAACGQLRTAGRIR